MEIVEKATKERRDLKRQAHAARQAILQAKPINDNIRFGWVEYETLSPEETTLVDEFNSRKINFNHVNG